MTGWIVAEMDVGNGTPLLGLAGEVPGVTVPPSFATSAVAWQRLQAAFAPSWWEVNSSLGDAGYAFDITHAGGTPVMSAIFTPRIELAASATSLSGRYTVFVQANNQESEVTVLDAQRGEQWTAFLPHDATLAAFAIGIHLNAAETCLIISEQRYPDSVSESWYINLVTHEVGEPVPGFVLAWLE